MLPSGSYNPSGYDQRINGRNYTCVARNDAGTGYGNVASKLTTTVVCGKEVNVGLSCNASTSTTGTGTGTSTPTQYWDF